MRPRTVLMFLVGVSAAVGFLALLPPWPTKPAAPSRTSAPSAGVVRVSDDRVLDYRSRFPKSVPKKVADRMHGAGEGIREVGLRSLTQGKTERVIVDGEALDVTWIGVQPREGRSGVTGHPMKPCCLSCGAMTVCGDAVSGSCGRCAGQPGPIPPGS